MIGWDQPPMMMAPKMMIHMKITIGNTMHMAMMHEIHIIFLNICPPRLVLHNREWV